MNKKKIVTVALTGIIGLGTIGATSIHAAGGNHSGTTKVSYSTENIVNENGKWIGVIPSDVSLNNTKKSKIIELQLKSGENQDPITSFHPDFKVEVTVSSDNKFKLIEKGKIAVPYTMVIGTEKWNGSGEDVGRVLELTKDKSILNGEISTAGTSVDGNYEDKLIFTFNATVDDPFTNL